MVIPRSVGVAPGTTTLKLGAPPSAGESCIYYGPVNTMGSGGARTPHKGQVVKAAAAPTGWDVYGSDVELQGHGLGYILTPDGYTPGRPPWEIVGVYGDAFGRRGCDPQHNSRGEAGFYYDTPLGGLGRGIPTDAQMSVEYGYSYTPVVNQMLPTADGQLLPLPWVPPDGWNPAGRSGPPPAAWAPPGQLGEGRSLPPEEEQRFHNDRMYRVALLGVVISGAVGLATAAVHFLSLRR